MKASAEGCLTATRSADGLHGVVFLETEAHSVPGRDEPLSRSRGRKDARALAVVFSQIGDFEDHARRRGSGSGLNHSTASSARDGPVSAPSTPARGARKRPGCPPSHGCIGRKTGTPGAHRSDPAPRPRWREARPSPPRSARSVWTRAAPPYTDV